MFKKCIFAITLVTSLCAAQNLSPAPPPGGNAARTAALRRSSTQGLLGRTASLIWAFPNLSTVFGNAGSATVGAGVEFTGCCSGAANVTFNVDLSDTVVRITNNTLNGVPFLDGAFNGVIITLPSVTSVSLASSSWPHPTLGDFSAVPQNLTFDSTHIYVNLANFLTTGSNQITLLVNTPAASISTSTLPNATAGAFYSQTLQAIDGSGSYSWSATGVPSPFTLSAGGVLSGTPTASLSSPASINVTLTDTVTGQTTSRTLTLAVPFISTTTSLSASPSNPSLFGSQITLTATVSPSSTGKVQFFDGSEALGTGILSSGTTTFSTPLLSAGVHKLKAFYIGNTTTSASYSSVLTRTITTRSQSGFNTGALFSTGTGTGPRGMAIGDFNKDGKPDVVTANFATNTVSVFLGTGSGTLGTPTTFTVASSPIGVATGDFDGDGNPDIAVAAYFSDTVSILLGNGAGSFGTVTNFSQPTGSRPANIAVADFNADGKTDLAVSFNGTAKVGVLFGTGTGSFGTAVEYTVGTHPSPIVVADFNNDAIADIATSSFDQGISVLLGQSNGTFGTVTNLATGGTQVYAVVAADFNGDGNIDLAAPNVASNNIGVLLGTGSGTFGSVTNFTTGNSPSFLAVGDFDGDNKIDIAAANNNASASLSVFAGNGSGSFAARVDSNFPSGSGSAWSLVVADFNGDGVSDIATISDSTNNVSVLLGIATTSTSLTSSVNPTNFGSSTTLTATVSPSTAGGTVTLASATATFSTNSLSVGTHSITAVYSGDPSFSSSTSSAVSQVVNQAPTTTSLSSSANPSIFGGTVIFTASVSVGTASGTVTFKDGATIIGTGSVSGGNATFSTQGLTAATHSITAVYEGDSNYLTSTSSAVSQVVNKATPGVFVTSASIHTGSNPGFSVDTAGWTLGGGASYQGGTGNPAGSVLLNNSGESNSDPTAARAVTGLTIGKAYTVTIDVLRLPEGAGNGTTFGIYLDNQPASPILLTEFADTAWHTVTASFTATATSHTIIFAAELDTRTPGVTSATDYPYFIDNFTLTAPFPTPTFGSPITFSSYLSTSSATGSVTFKDGATTLGSGTITSGVATLTTSAISAGTHSITSDYAGDSNFNSATSPVFSQPVNSSASTTTLSSSANPSTFGSSVIFTAGVSPSNATGTIAFKDGATILGTVTVTSGSASFSTPALAVGTHSMTAVYSGDANFGTSTSLAVSQAVNQSSSATSVSSLLSPSTFGTSVTFSVSVTPSGATGTVTFKDGAATLGTGSLVEGLATFSTSALLVGSHSITAVYGGSVSFVTSTSPAISQVVNQATTTSSVSFSPNPAAFGATVTFNASVSPSAATGTVTFKDGATTLGTGTLAGGTATFSTTSLSVASHSISVVYGGDAGFLTSTSSPQSLTVNQATTTISLVSTANPSAFGASVGFTATVSPSTAAGTVTFSEGSVIGTATISGGVAVFNTSALSLGTHAITASYGGDTNFLTSNSSALSQVVSQGVTTTSLSSSPNPSTFGASVTFTAGVSPSTAGGTIAFKDGATILGTVTVTSGSASFSTPALAVGTHSMTAVFSGDTNFGTSTSSAVSQAVNRATSATSVSSLLNPSTFGTSVTFSASVTPSGATGTVTFKDGATTLGSGTLVEGLATFATSALLAGSHSITAVYGGDVSFVTSTSSAISQVVNQSTTTTSFISSLNPATFGTGVTFTASVNPSGAEPSRFTLAGHDVRNPSSGVVTFKDGATTLGTGTLAGGTATFTIAALSVGTHSITASYGGDSNLATSTSSPQSQVVNQSATTTALTSSSNPSSFGVTVGFKAVVTPSTATGTVTFQDGGVSIGTGTLSGGVAVFSTSALGVSAHVITAVYGGDSGFITSTSAPLSQAVNRAATTLSLLPSANPGTFAANITLTVAVSPSGATGTVTFVDGGVTLGTSTIAGGSASFITSSLSVGTHSITATYAGDAGFLSGSSSVLSEVVNQAASATALTSSANPASFGAGVTFSASVSPSTATGTVTFKDGVTTLGSASLVAGSATFTTSALSVASHAITAGYSGDLNYLTSTSAITSQVINQATSTTSVTSSLNPSTFSANVIFTASVTPSTATGTVTFKDGSTILGTGTIAGGTASFSTTGLSVTGHAITAVYGGDTSFLTSTSGLLTQTVNQGGTSITLTSSLSPAAFGANVIFSMNVTPPSATGTVTVKDGPTAIGTVSLVSGAAVFATSALSSGNHTMTAVYNGDTSNAGATSGVFSQQITQVATTTSVSSSPNPSTSPEPVTITARVSIASATGNVTFTDNGAALGSVPVSGGVAALTTTALKFGKHSLVAAYSGDPGNAPSTSAPSDHTVNLKAPVLNPLTLLNGEVNKAYSPATFTATGGSGTYTFTATGVPAGLAVNSAGSLAGTPTDAFTGSLTVTVKDTVSGLTATAGYVITVTFPPLTLTGPANLGNVAVGSTIAGSYTAAGGKTPYTFTLTGAAGLSIDSAGKVTGTAGTAGRFDATITVTDALGKTESQAAVLTVLGFITSSIPPATTISNYSAAIAAAGGIPPYTFTASGFPDGITFSNGTFAGKATVQGSFSVAVQLRDSAGLTVNAAYPLTVTGPSPLKIFTTTLPDATAGTVYTAKIEATGGTTPYKWTQTGGNLPGGLTLAETGDITGSPVNPGTFPLGVQIVDANGTKSVGSVTIKVLAAALRITSGSTLPSGVIFNDYPQQILSATGGVPPYTFGIRGTLPAGLVFANGQIDGLPTIPGDFSFTVTAADSATPPATGSLGVSVTMRPNTPDLVVNTGTLSFGITSGTNAIPSPFAVSVNSSVVAQVLNYSTRVNVPWLSVTGPTSTPGALSVSLNSASLALSPAGSPYSTTVVVSCTSTVCAGKTQSFGVTLTVTAPPPQLSIGTPLISFSTLSTNPATLPADIAVSNAGGGSLTVNSITAADTWLTVGTFPAGIAPGPAASVAVTANPAGLKAGYYTSLITVRTNSGTGTVPVSLRIAAAATMTLGPEGTQLSVPQGGTLGNTTGSFLVSLSGGGAVTYTAVVQPGAPWLTVPTGSGTASGTASGTVNYALNTTAVAALAQGTYYGTVQVTAPGIVNSPKDFQVVLDVTKPATRLVPTLLPSGLVFTSSGTGTVAPQTVRVLVSSAAAVPYQASPTADDGGTWLSITNAQGTASASAAGQIPVSVNTAGLRSGTYRGSVSVSFSSSAVRTVNVTLIVPASTSGAAGEISLRGTVNGVPQAGPLCAGGTLVPTQTGLVSNFSAPTSWPTPLAIRLIDTCGTAVSGGQIVTTFSNGDPPLALSLVDPVAGIYSGTWTPRKASAQVNITASASAAGYAPVKATIAGQVAPNSAPVIAPNGTQDIFHPQVGAGLGPGNVVQIYGTGLASQIAQPLKLPLPTTVSGTQVLIGGIPAPLFYVSPGQVNAQIPFELQANKEYQVVVNANGALTTPQPIQLNAGTPAILDFSSGAVVAQHADGTLILDAAPAKPGEYVVIYASGLGATDVTVESGAASPVEPLARVKDVPVLTLNDVVLKTLYTGLTPGFVGLYQINFQVPENTADGNYSLLLNQSGTASNSTILTVKK